jgi:hypothetical protein
MAGKPRSTDSDADSREVFYHALYHHLAHWAAYTAMVGLLVTIGVGLSLTPIASDATRGARAAGVGVAIICALLGAFYFVKGMDTYGALVNERLPEAYLRKTQTFPHKMMIAVGMMFPPGNHDLIEMRESDLAHLASQTRCAVVFKLLNDIKAVREQPILALRISLPHAHASAHCRFVAHALLRV